MRIPPLLIKIMLESNPLKSRILVGRLAVLAVGPRRCRRRAGLLGRGGCSGWRAQVEQQAGHSHITNAVQILEIRCKIASDYTWFPLHPPVQNVERWARLYETEGEREQADELKSLGKGGGRLLTGARGALARDVNARPSKPSSTKQSRPTRGPNRFCR